MEDRRLTIAVIAPSGIPDPDALDRGVALLESWGHAVLPGRHVREVHRYTAGTAEQRSQDLAWALTDPAVDVVWMARGGFGIQHCLGRLESLPLPLPLPDKMVIGCSDATVLLQWLALQGHRRLFHGPWLAGLATDADDATRHGVRQWLQLPDGPGHLDVEVSPAERIDGVRGKLVGGNLTMLASLCGGPLALRVSGAILMLEDVTEHAFRMDRCLTQLVSSGAMAGVQAIVLGEFVRCYLPQGADYSAAELVADLLRPLGVPVVHGARFGHGTRNLAWPYGRQAVLQGTRLSF